MRLEPHSFLGVDFAACTQRKHLIATAVGQYGAVPAVETVQSAGVFQYLQSGAQVQVVGIAENDLGFDIFTHILDVYGFDGAYCAYRHENRGLNVAMVGVNQSCSGRAFRVGMLNYKLHFVSIFRQKYIKNPKL